MTALVVPPLLPADQALANFLVCRTTDIKEAVVCGEHMFCKNRLEQKGQQFHANFFHRATGAASIARMSFGGEVTIDPGKLDDFILVQALINGHEEVISGEHHLRCTTDHATIFNYHKNSFLNHFVDTEKLLVRLDRRLLETTLQQQLGRRIKTGIIFQPQLPLNVTAGQSWLQSVAWAYTHLSNTPVLSSHVAAHIEEVLASVLLDLQEHNYSSALLEAAQKQVMPSIIRIAEEYLEAHAHEPISVADIAARAGVSSRALYLSFQRFRGVSPMQHLKEIRLRRARSDLQAEHLSHIHVSAIAMKWGFNHLGRFSTEYKSRYGESPSATNKRLLNPDLDKANF